MKAPYFLVVVINGLVGIERSMVGGLRDETMMDIACMYREEEKTEVGDFCWCR